MIMGRDLLEQLSIDIKFSNQTLSWQEVKFSNQTLSWQEVTIPMKTMDELDQQNINKTVE